MEGRKWIETRAPIVKNMGSMLSGKRSMLNKEMETNAFSAVSGVPARKTNAANVAKVTIRHAQIRCRIGENTIRQAQIRCRIGQNIFRCRIGQNTFRWRIGQNTIRHAQIRCRMAKIQCGGDQGSPKLYTHIRKLQVLMRSENNTSKEPDMGAITQVRLVKIPHKPIFFKLANSFSRISPICEQKDGSQA